MIILRLDSVEFWSLKDEELFFRWLKSIKAIRSVQGEGTSILLELNAEKISKETYHELFAICKRYRIPISTIKEVSKLIKKIGS